MGLLKRPRPRRRWEDNITVDTKELNFEDMDWMEMAQDCLSPCSCCSVSWLIVGGGVQLGPLGTAATNRPIVPSPRDYDDGEIGGMIGRGNRSTRRKPAPVPLCPSQTPHTARTRTRAAVLGSQRLTAWATARPVSWLTLRPWRWWQDGSPKPWSTYTQLHDSTSQNTVVFIVTSDITFQFSEP
jgi:hypothetical protein